jgi:hypothetical protein
MSCVGFHGRIVATRPEVPSSSERAFYAPGGLIERLGRLLCYVAQRVFEKLTLPLRSRAHLRDYGSHQHPMLRHRSQRRRLGLDRPVGLLYDLIMAERFGEDRFADAAHPFQRSQRNVASTPIGNQGITQGGKRLRSRHVIHRQRRRSDVGLSECLFERDSSVRVNIFD